MNCEQNITSTKSSHIHISRTFRKTPFGDFLPFRVVLKSYEKLIMSFRRSKLELTSSFIKSHFAVARRENVPSAHCTQIISTFKCFLKIFSHIRNWDYSGARSIELITELMSAYIIYRSSRWRIKKGTRKERK
jgi:hypothetical protein